MALSKQTVIPWYHSGADFVLLKHVSADGHLLPESFEEWIEQTETSIALLTARGWTVEKVYLDPVVFPAWCRALGLRINSHARIAFALSVAARRYPDAR